MKYRGYLFQDISGISLNEYAFERTYTTHIYDVSGVLIDVIQPKEIAVFPCKACLKDFATKQSLERHLERFPVCKAWKEEDGLVLTEPVHQWASNLIGDALQGESPRHCKFCNTEFSTVGNFNKHFRTSVPCNRFAYKAVKEAFAEA